MKSKISPGVGEKKEVVQEPQEKKKAKKVEKSDDKKSSSEKKASSKEKKKAETTEMPVNISVGEEKKFSERKSMTIIKDPYETVDDFWDGNVKQVQPMEKESREPRQSKAKKEQQISSKEAVHELHINETAFNNHEQYDESRGESSSIIEIVRGFHSDDSVKVTRSLGTIEPKSIEKMKGLNDDTKMLQMIYSELLQLRRQVNGLARNIGCLYEMGVGKELEVQYPSFKLTSPHFVQVSKVPRYAQKYHSKLFQCHLDPKDIQSLLITAKSEIELNFLLKHNKRVIIIEATMSSFFKDEYLLRKMVQLERQIICYRLENEYERIEIVGLASPSHLTIEKIEQICNENSVLQEVSKFVKNGAFVLHKIGNKPSVEWE